MQENLHLFRQRSLEDVIEAIHLFAQGRTYENGLLRAADSATSTPFFGSSRRSCASASPSHLAVSTRSTQRQPSTSLPMKTASELEHSCTSENENGLLSFVDILPESHAAVGEESGTGGRSTNNTSTRSTSYGLPSHHSSSERGTVSLRWGPVDGKDIILQHSTEAIGKGAVATVYPGRLFVCPTSHEDHDSPTPPDPSEWDCVMDVAVKVIRSAAHLYPDVDAVTAVLLRRFALNHPHVVTAFFCVVLPADPSKEKWLPDMSNAKTMHLAIAMEYANGGTLAGELRRKERLSEDAVREVLQDLLQAVHYLHDELSFVHNDIKPLNILLFHSALIPVKADFMEPACGPEGGVGSQEHNWKDVEEMNSESLEQAHKGPAETAASRPVYKLTDFGSCRNRGAEPISSARLQRIREELTTKTGHEPVFFGTATHMSPESCLGIDDSAASDIWSIGVTVFQLVTGQVPWRPMESAYPHIIVNGYRAKFKAGHMFATGPSHQGGATAGAINAFLSHREQGNTGDDYATFGPILDEIESPGFSPEVRDFVKKCLEEDPTKRPTCDALMRHPFTLGKSLRTS